jgi:ornithine cyclodeaminase/alanine dehydrogenase-like protein (mu-crystallin family)
MLYLTESEVRRLLPMPEAIELVRDEFAALASGQAVNHPRRRLVLPTRSALHYMTGGDGSYFGAKIYSTHPGKGAHFLFLLYRSADGAPLALLEANYLGQIRTGAATGVASALLARPGSIRVAILGSGFQARTQLEAVCAALTVDSVRVWSRSAEKRSAFASEMSIELGMAVEAARTAEEAVREADVIVTATSSPEPVLKGTWVKPGALINAIGSNHPRRREVDSELVHRAGLVVVDSREQSRMESGDLLLAPLDESGWERTVELQELVAGRIPPRRDGEITLFKSNGLAVEDVVCAGRVYEKALANGIGRAVYS